MITLKTLPQATDQEVFDQVTIHMIKQGRKSTNQSGLGCLYRGESGLKCAAGCLMSDDEYNKNMEGNGWVSLVKDKVVPSDHLFLITQLQRIHDNIVKECWEEEFRKIASHFGLRNNFLIESKEI